jgi:hypothetical protein
LPRGEGGVQRVAEDVVLPPNEALAEAQRLLDVGRPFHAHEVLEGVWKAALPQERDLWQGLAQLAVGLTHAARGNPRGAATLLRRGRDRLAVHPASAASDGPGSLPYGVDVPGLMVWASALADRLDGVAPEVFVIVPPPVLVP